MGAYIFTFASSHAALACEKACDELNEHAGLIPVPSGIRAGCGMGLLLYRKSDDEAVAFAHLLHEKACVATQLEGVYAKEDNPSQAAYRSINL